MFFCSACLEKLKRPMRLENLRCCYCETGASHQNKCMAINIGNCMQPFASLSATKLLDGAVARLDRVQKCSEDTCCVLWHEKPVAKSAPRPGVAPWCSRGTVLLTNWSKTLHPCKASRMSCCRQLLASLLCVHIAAVRPSCNSVGHWSFVQEKINELYQS